MRIIIFGFTVSLHFICVVNMIQWCSSRVFSLILLCSLSHYVSGQFFNNRPYPTYSLESMPNTGFSCRDKILGGYYADAETQCQMFHVCVKVAGVGVQDFRFLCPNGTAFDQDSQICADWDDVDCEASTLYYSSDNFDLYRIGSGFETKNNYANEDESAFHLQRADSGDVRLQKENQINQKPEYNIQGNPPPRVKSNQQTKYTNDREIFRGSSSSNFFNNRNGGKEDDYENYDNAGNNRNEVPKEEKSIRKVIRRPTTTVAPSTTTTIQPKTQKLTTFKQPGQSSQYTQQPGQSNQYTQQPGQSNQYSQKPGQSNQYTQQPSQSSQYSQNPGQNNQYTQQPSQSSQYTQQQTPTTFKPTGFARNQYRNQPSNYSPTTTKPSSTTITDEQYTTALNNYRARQQQQGRSYNKDTSFRQKSRFSTNQQFPSTQSASTNSRNANKYTPNAQYDNQQSTQYYDGQSYVSSTTPKINYNDFRYSTPAPFEKSTQKAFEQRVTTTTSVPFSNYYTNVQSSTVYPTVNATNYYTNQQNRYYSSETPSNYQQNSNQQYTTTTTVKPVQTNNYYGQQDAYNQQNFENTRQDKFNYNAGVSSTTQSKQSAKNYQDTGAYNVGVSSTTQQYFESNRQGKQTSKTYYNNQKSTNYQDEFNYNSGVSSTTQYPNSKNYYDDKYVATSTQYPNVNRQSKVSKTYFNDQKTTGITSTTTSPQYNNYDFSKDAAQYYKSTQDTAQYSNVDRQTKASKTYFNEQITGITSTTVAPQYNNYDFSKDASQYYNSERKGSQDSAQYTQSYTKVDTVKPYNTNDYYQSTQNYNTTEKYNYNGQYNEKPTTYNPKYKSAGNEETLKTAHSINFASGRNENYNGQPIKSNTEKSTYNESPRPFSVSRNSKQSQYTSTTSKPTPQLKQTTKNLSKKVTEADDKSYDYAYYDNDSHFTDYDNIGTEFAKTTRKSK